MALASRKHWMNVAGPWFVDDTCIDCAVCREHAPEIFADAGDASYVAKQPAEPDELRRAWLALLACPVGSIGGGPKQDAAFPIPIAPKVWLCGYTSEDTFGANSYFVERDGGNLLVDAPRPVAGLLDWIERRGGIADILLTHADDVAGADSIGSRFRSRIHIHEDDAVAFATRRFRDEVALRPGLRAIPCPGHTAGSAVFLLDETFLFTGDSLAWNAAKQELYAFRDACWYSWKTQADALERLITRRFSWVLPGHGRRTPAPVEGLDAKLRDLVARMRR
jgi:glyoxylase-like metal-dependent hydrolase (beta-lactamase superfamily II)